jgi:hypothetical protein
MSPMIRPCVCWAIQAEAEKAAALAPEQVHESVPLNPSGEELDTDAAPEPPEN